NALQILEAEILYSQSPLLDAFETISKQVPNPIQSFFQLLVHKMNVQGFNLTQLWDECVNELINQSSLGMNEAEILKQFGRTLGQHDFIQQQKAIQLTVQHIDREFEDASDMQYNYSRLFNTLVLFNG